MTSSNKTRKKIPYAKMIFESDEKDTRSNNHRKLSNLFKPNKSSTMLDCYQNELITDYGALKANWLFSNSEIDRQISVDDNAFSDNESDQDSFEDDFRTDDIINVHHRESLSDMKNLVKLASTFNSKLGKKSIKESEESSSSNAYFCQIYENDTVIKNLLIDANTTEAQSIEEDQQNVESKACNLM